MPRFYFHLYNDVTACDEEGQELADAEAARARAISSARELAAANVLEGYLNLAHRIDVQDESGRTVAMVRFADVVKLKA